MLRRRRKTTRLEKHETPGPAPAVRSRRRGRPDAPVPADLLVREEEGVAKAPVRKATPRPGKGEAVVLVTGFEPFGGETSNPSWEICALLPHSIAGMRVETCRVPCEFRRSIEVVAAAIERHRPAIVLCVGQAGGRAHLSVERVAINVDDARIADNAGAQPIDQPVVAGAPTAYFGTLPIKRMVAALQQAGFPASVSQTAGTFVCNHVFFGLMHSLRRKRSVRAGFMHLPLMPEQANAPAPAPSLPLHTMVAGVRLALEVALATGADLHASGGAEH
jgi:pyroglutamyl-peptidase